MVHLTEAAQRQLEQYFQDKDRSAVRIFLSSGG